MMPASLISTRPVPLGETATETVRNSPFGDLKNPTLVRPMVHAPTICPWALRLTATVEVLPGQSTVVNSLPFPGKGRRRATAHVAP
jgi:hypothetical protein